jgi:hypothetical protein
MKLGLALIFKNNNRAVAVYDARTTCSDDEVAQLLGAFFASLERETKDLRYNDPGVIAARFTVWRSAQYAVNAPLNFTDLAITSPQRAFELAHCVADVICISENQPTVFINNQKSVHRSG